MTYSSKTWLAVHMVSGADKTPAKKDTSEEEKTIYNDRPEEGSLVVEDYEEWDLHHEDSAWGPGRNPEWNA